MLIHWTVIRDEWNGQAAIMRFYEGNYAYEIEQVRDPATQLLSGWRYKVYQIRPLQQFLRSGEAATQQEAERAGQKALEALIRADGNRAA